MPPTKIESPGMLVPRSMTCTTPASVNTKAESPCDRTATLCGEAATGIVIVSLQALVVMHASLVSMTDIENGAPLLVTNAFAPSCERTTWVGAVPTAILFTAVLSPVLNTTTRLFAVSETKVCVCAAASVGPRPTKSAARNKTAVKLCCVLVGPFVCLMRESSL